MTLLKRLLRIWLSVYDLGALVLEHRLLTGRHHTTRYKLRRFHGVTDRWTGFCRLLQRRLRVLALMFPKVLQELAPAVSSLIQSLAIFGTLDSLVHNLRI